MKNKYKLGMFVQIKGANPIYGNVTGIITRNDGVRYEISTAQADIDPLVVIESDIICAFKPIGVKPATVKKTRKPKTAKTKPKSKTSKQEMPPQPKTKADSKEEACPF